jgi:hypothetical protein
MIVLHYLMIAETPGGVVVQRSLLQSGLDVREGLSAGP